MYDATERIFIFAHSQQLREVLPCIDLLLLWLHIEALMNRHHAAHGHPWETCWAWFFYVRRAWGSAGCCSCLGPTMGSLSLRHLHICQCMHKGQGPSPNLGIEENDLAMHIVAYADCRTNPAKLRKAHKTSPFRAHTSFHKQRDQ